MLVTVHTNVLICAVGALQACRIRSGAAILSSDAAAAHGESARRHGRKGRGSRGHDGGKLAQVIATRGFAMVHQRHVDEFSPCPC